jgi:hypothetical protein
MSNPKGGPNKFKPGASGNPSGRPPDPPALKELKSLNRMQMQTLMNEVFQLNRLELKRLCKSKTESAVKVMLAKILDDAIRSGDYKRAEFFFGRLFGRVPVRIADSDGQPLSFVQLIQIAEKKAA